MKFIAIAEMNDYADFDGGWQAPVRLKAANMQDAILEAQAYVVKEGKANPREKEYLVGKLTIFQVTDEHDLDIEALNAQIPRSEYPKDQEEEERTEDDQAQLDQIKQAAKDEEHRERLKKLLDGSSFKKKPGLFNKKKRSG